MPSSKNPKSGYPYTRKKLKCLLLTFVSLLELPSDVPLHVRRLPCKME